jgi:hypothetical protein
MLRSRCISEGIRAVYPGCVVGTYSVEEVQDFDDKPAKASSPEVKDMGAAEVVEAVQSSKKVGEDFLPLLVPGQEEPFDMVENLEDWQTSFHSMISRVKASPKYSEKEKLDKLKAFKLANQSIIEQLSNEARLRVLAAVTNVEEV